MVLLIDDIPEENLKVGMIRVVIGICTDPAPAYEVDFCDDSRGTIAQLALSPEILKL